MHVGVIKGQIVYDRLGCYAIVKRSYSSLALAVGCGNLR